MKLWRWIDNFLNGITMYKLVLYELRILIAAAIGFSLLGQIHYSVVAMLVSLGALLVVCFAGNWLLAKFWNAPTNKESPIITSLILFFLLPPVLDAKHLAALVIAGLAAVASKYILAVHYRHIFNPAAFGAFAVGFLGLSSAIWWVATPVLLPFTAVCGLLVLRKVRRFQMFLCFAAAALVTMLIIGLGRDREAAEIIKTAFTSWPLVFLGTVMLTEPSTMPWRRWQQLVYGMIVGVIFASQTHIGPVSSTPQVALLIGNLFAFAVSPKFKMRLSLKAKTELAPNIYDFAFTPDRKPVFTPGQYMEWTMPLGYFASDDRGNRRTFTVASSPTEPELHIGVKFYEPSSVFKKRLREFQPGALLVAGQVAGSFTLSDDPAQKLVFVAGGIGITPFRSMLKYLLDTDQRRDIVLFYMLSNKDEVAYKDVLEAAEGQGVRVIKVLNAKEPDPSWTGLTGFLTPEILALEVPDYQARTFYVSGPNAMVQNYKSMLRKTGVKAIKTDYFSGY